MRVAVLVVAYNAVDTIADVLRRIPDAVMDRVAEVAVFDDASADQTYEAALQYKRQSGNPKLNVYRNERNLGYGGNQKRGYSYCIQRGHEAVVLLHGDGQYAPEVLGELLDALEHTEADAVFGSRMMVRGAALRGGMPRYKYVGNKILTGIENWLLGSELSEFHSGYRVYRTRALQQVPYELNTDDFHFDTEIIVQLLARGLRIVEIPIPTHYGDEVCHVNGLKYARDVVRTVLRYRLHKLTLTYDPRYDLSPGKYGFHATRHSCHSQVLDLVPEGSRVLALGVGLELLASPLRAKGCTVVGLGSQISPVAKEALDEAYESDPDHDWPARLADDRFDVIILLDVLEHSATPHRVLAQARAHLQPGGRVIASVPNAAHLYVRLNLLLGRFEYAERGILDWGHLRFFTRPSFLRALKAAGLRIVRVSATPLPFASVYPGGQAPLIARWAEGLSYAAARLWPGPFAYQHLAVAESIGTDPAQLPPRIGGVGEEDDVVHAQQVED